MDQIYLKQAAGKIPSEISSKILTVGPDYRNHKGGVGAVIELYHKYFETFNFISTYKGGGSFSKIFCFLKGFFRLFVVLLSDKKIKVIHLHGASNGSFYRKFFVFIIAKFLFKKKIVYHIHGGGFHIFYKENNDFSKRLINLFLNKSDIIICVSDSWVEYFRKNHKINKITVLPNMIDFPEKHRRAKRSQIISFLFLGLVCESKGIFDLIHVVGKNKNKYVGRMKLFIGGNGEIEKLNNLIKNYQIENVVEYLGWVNQKRKTEVLNSADVYILPSYAEGSPVSILEAMAYGMAIISTKVGGIPELVRENQNGFLIEPGNPDQIESSLDRIISNPSIIEKFGSVSESIVQKHLPDSVLGQLIPIYQSLMVKNKITSE